MQPTLSIVVPVYNEEQNIALLHEAVARVVDRVGLAIELIYVDDGSRDRSWEQIEQEASRDPRVRGLKFVANCGETAASEAGMRAARGTYIMTMDADLQNDPEDIPAFMDALAQGWDCVCGSRVEVRGKGDNFIRVASSRLANWVRNRLSEENISDAGCTYRAFKRQCIDRVKLYRGLHRFIPTLLKMEGFTVTEIPVRNNPRIHGQSKYGVWNRLFKSFHDLLAIRWMKSRLLRYQIAVEVGPPGDRGERAAAAADDSNGPAQRDASEPLLAESRA